MSSAFRVLIVVILSLLGISAAASPIQLTLTLDPAETLPGLPVSFRLQAVNPSSSPARLPRWAVLEVTPRNGQPFLTVAGMPRGMQRAAELRDGGRTMKAGETRRLDWWARPESPPWWGGAFWLEPGLYSLRLIADDGLENYGGDRYSPEGLADPILSNSAVLTIRQPKGADADVWQLAKVTANWNWLSIAANEIWTRYPESTYAGYTVPQSIDGKRDVTLAAIERILRERTVVNRPHGAYLDWWRFMAVQFHDEKMDKLVKTDPNAAYQHVQTMRRYVDAILANDTEPGLKKMAREIKLNLPTLAQLEESSRNRRNIYAPLQKMSPVVECVTPALDGSFTAQFGYDNPNAYVVILFTGPENNFSPLPQDRGQETHFLPGRQRNVFTVTHTGDNLVWTVHGKTATASEKHPTRCPERSETASDEETQD